MTPPPSRSDRSSGAVVLSWASPPVRMKRSGERGSWWSVPLGNAPEPDPEPPFSGGGLLVSPDQGGIKHQILVVRIARQALKDPLPDPLLGPAREALMHALPLAVALRKVAPACPRAQHPQDRVDEQPVVLAGPAGIAGLARQNALDPTPLHLCQLVALDHRSVPNHPTRNAMNQRSQPLRIWRLL